VGVGTLISLREGVVEVKTRRGTASLRGQCQKKGRQDWTRHTPLKIVAGRFYMLKVHSRLKMDFLGKKEAGRWRNNMRNSEVGFVGKRTSVQPRLIVAGKGQESFSQLML